MTDEKNMNASFSTLVLSVASTAAMNLGIAPHPESSKQEKNLGMAKFNIDLLRILEEKTKNNLTKDEKELLERIVQDLQLQFVNTKKQEH